MKVGLISDTHNLLRPEVIVALKNVDAILHGGDINSQQVLDQLQSIATVYAVRGNADKEWAENLPTFLDFKLSGHHIYMTHKKKDLPADLEPYDLVMVGHSHTCSDMLVEKTRIINPGSCGPRRFHQPITMAMAVITETSISVTRIDIAHAVPSPKIDPSDTATQIEIVIREFNKGRSTKKIAEKYGIDSALAEQIIRLYVTHPGVTTDGIMTKMGL
jgi:phosphoesterase, MJ0936 family